MAMVRVVTVTVVVVSIVESRLDEATFLAGAPISATLAIFMLLVAPAIAALLATLMLANHLSHVMRAAIRTLLVTSIQFTGRMWKAHQEFEPGLHLGPIDDVVAPDIGAPDRSEGSMVGHRTM